uniref:Uncharacterized protein n=1 Tax=Chlorella vulgaris TaxID=3077 RepID=V9H0R9_CHLVU|nr:hypothetical protein ChvulCp044 [Chlorella vulgaris]pir/T07231/ hypothetical protein 91 - Chlorella vulgaris chloroplast [Chlorella vulgaris]BAA57878.1 unnamed protein product [Chlorella vulgaris]
MHCNAASRPGLTGKEKPPAVFVLFFFSKKKKEQEGSNFSLNHLYGESLMHDCPTITEFGTALGDIIKRNKEIEDKIDGILKNKSNPSRRRV